MEPIDTVYEPQKQKKAADGQIPVSVRMCDFQPGGIVAFYHGNQRLNSRFISASWDWFGIGENGNVSNNGNEPDEPYLTGNAAGCMAAERIAGRAFYAIVISILRTGNAVRKY